MPLTPQTRLGQYEIVASLGAGGMGEVYRARDLRLGREVALKVLPKDVARDAARLARFEQEARAVAALNHPGIVTLFSVEDADNTRFLTMELVEGQSLDHHITAGGMPLARVLELGIALADALTAAHEKGVVHRDLKPANVMLTREGRVKVLDFGLAKLARGEVEPGATMAHSAAGQAVGTAPYMAPEQLRGEEVDARADLFALGIVLYELSTGTRPFAGGSSVEVSSAILRDTPKPMPSAELGPIVSQCLEKNPRERVQTAQDVSNALRRLRKALEGKAAAHEPPPAEKLATLAVLPFVNRSASAEDEYFSDGLADELQGVLSRIKGLRVAARASAFHFKGKDVPIAEIGKALNVATVLDGSVRKAGNRIRVTVELVQVADGFHLWSETYDRTLDDIFAVQDDIAQSVVKELRTALLGAAADSDASGEARAEVAQAAKGRGTDPEAHRLYLLARHLMAQQTSEAITKAVEYLEAAIALEPEFALAWAEFSRVQVDRSNLGLASIAEARSRAREAVNRALALGPDLAGVHVANSWIQMILEWDWHAAKASLRRALELEPGNADALRRQAALANLFGRFEEGLALLRQALERDPLSLPALHMRGSTLLSLGRFAESEASLRKALELGPGRVGSRGQLAYILAAQGRGEEAMAEATTMAEGPMRLQVLAILHLLAGRRAESDAALRTLTEQHAENYAFQIAEVFAARGETDTAFQWLDRGYAEHDTGLAEMLSSSQLLPLHGDPRWGALKRKMGFET